ncbi:hypothetical protein Cylst_5609 [Cylindrospermum stagnale PCC 7417]|uniref:Uncharacterized protein n=1 Tax=Cylindrospermum stagnale PCC 7417 TaxID=56107 RepID=K9X4M2_9NOST|nr:hypothetical protein [Cylindrospermum stagnale]AFZ27610.1 hypothetical protein Cylst_5609 [Cylindrospermum stagnale PCC 7417]
MSAQIINSELVADLSTEEQQLIAGGRKSRCTYPTGRKTAGSNKIGGVANTGNIGGSVVNVFVLPNLV